eukprot:TCONS_00002361-protein
MAHCQQISLFFLAMICLKMIVLVAETSNITASEPTKLPTNNESHNDSNETVEYIMDAIFWEQKPFLFFNKEKGEFDGIIPNMFSQANEFCIPPEKNRKIINYTMRLPSRKAFFDLVHAENTTYGEGLLAGFKSERAMWFPVLAYADRNQDKLRKNLKL